MHIGCHFILCGICQNYNSDHSGKRAQIGGRRVGRFWFLFFALVNVVYCANDWMLCVLSSKVLIP